MSDKPTQPKMQVLSQFIRDLSFENIAAQKNLNAELKPEIKVNVGLDASKRNEAGQYEIIIKLNCEANAEGESLFLLEMDYAGRFLIENVPDNQLHPFLLIECPRMLFPFVRRIVSDVTRDGGYPPLNIDNIDFVSLYQKEAERRAALQKEKGAEAEAGPNPAEA